MKKKFLPNVSKNRLRKMEKNEKDPKAKMILLACIAKKEKMKLKDIAQTLNTPYNTIRGWINRVAKDGLKRRHDIKNKGAACKLDNKQIRKLLRTLDKGPKSAGYESNLWTLRLINKYIKKEFKVDYHDESIWQLLRRLEFRPIVPRPRHPKSATPEEREEFKKKAHRMTAFWTNRGYAVLVQDEAHVYLKIVPKRTWSRQKKPVISTKGMWGNKRVTIMGVIGKDGTHYFDLYDSGNWENTKKFLLKVHEQFGPVLIFMDNASYHKKREIRALTRKFEGKIQVRFLLPYTPELSPIEPQWTGCKKWVNSTPLENLAHLSKGLKTAINQGVVKIVKLHDYYIA